MCVCNDFFQWHYQRPYLRHNSPKCVSVGSQHTPCLAHTLALSSSYTLSFFLFLNLQRDLFVHGFPCTPDSSTYPSLYVAYPPNSLSSNILHYIFHFHKILQYPNFPTAQHTIFCWMKFLLNFCYDILNHKLSKTYVFQASADLYYPLLLLFKPYMHM